MSDETFDLSRAASFNSRRRNSKMDDLRADLARLRELLGEVFENIKHSSRCANLYLPVE